MGQPRIGVFVQVRLGSSRLPRKALLPLGGSTVIGQAMAALSGVSAAARALLTDQASAPFLEEPAGREGFEVVVGPALDVLARYALAARRFGVDTVVRATGDSPLVSASLVRSILEEHAACDADLSHYIGCPLGTGVEVIRVSAIEEASRAAVDPVEREHMSTYLYRHPERFRIVEPKVPPELTHLEANVSVDTPEDYERVKAIYADLYSGSPLEVQDVVRWLERHPDRVSLKHLTY